MKLLLLKLLKFALIFLVVIVVFLVNYFFFAWFLSTITTTPPLYKDNKPYLVYASSNGVHMDLIFHKSLLKDDFLQQMESVPNADYLAIGWGDKGFYLHTPSWAELKISTAVKAGFLPSSTLMHVTHFKQVNSKWKSIPLCQEQLDLLTSFVYQSFKYNKGQELRILEGAGYHRNDFFYEAKGNYTCLYTCNVWVNQALKKAHVQTAVWSPFDWGILKHL